MPSPLPVVVSAFASAFRTPDFYRVRIGVGRPPGSQDPVDFVLSPFAAREREEVEVLVEDAADAALLVVTEGLASAQDRYNRGGVRDG